MHFKKILSKLVKVIALIVFVFASFFIQFKNITIKAQNLNNPFTKTIGSGIGVQGIYTEADYDMAKEMGVSTIRGEASWYYTENPRGVYNFSASDFFINNTTTRGIIPILLVDYGNSLYYPPYLEGYTDQTYANSFQMCFDEEQDAYVNFSRLLLNRFKNKGVIWEFMNEPDLFIYRDCLANMPSGTTKGELYGKLLNKLSVLKDEFPNEFMISGGIAFAGSFWDDMLNNIPVANFRKFDAVGYHEYDNISGKDGRSGYRTWKRAVIQNSLNNKGLGDMQLFDTETGGSGADNFESVPYEHMWDGFDSDGTLSDLQQAGYAPKAYLYGLINSSNLHIFHRWTDAGPQEIWPPGYEREMYFGFVRFDRTKKPSYHAFKTLIDNLKGYTYVANRSVDNPNNSDLYRIINADLEFEKAGKKAYAFWAVQESPIDANNVYKHIRTASFNIQNGYYKAVDMLGENIRYENDTTGTTTIQSLNEYPVYYIQETPVINLSIKANLSGAYNTTTNKNNTFLRNINLIPLKGRSNLPANSVDWVTVELWQGNVQKGVKEELIDENGNINISFENITSGLYKVILRHRNHLAIATNTDVTLTNGNLNNIDFTTNQNVKANNQTLLKPNIYGLRLGNANSDNSIDSFDRNQLKITQENSSTYDNSDLNLDGIIDASDRNLLRQQAEASESL